MGKVDLKVHVNKEGILDKLQTKGNYLDTKMEWTIKFAKPLKRSTVNTRNMYVQDSNKRQLQVSFLYNEESSTLTIKPLEDYEADRDYFLTVTTRVKALDGSKFPQDLVITFNQKSLPKEDMKEKTEQARARLEQRRASRPNKGENDSSSELSFSQKYKMANKDEGNSY